MFIFWVLILNPIWRYYFRHTHSPYRDDSLLLYQDCNTIFIMEMNDELYRLWHCGVKTANDFFAGHLNTWTELRIQPDRKGEGLVRRKNCSDVHEDKTSEKVGNCTRMCRLEHLSTQLFEVIRFSLSKSFLFQMLKSPIKWC